MLNYKSSFVHWFSGFLGKLMHLQRNEVEKSKPTYRLSKMITLAYFELQHKKLSVFSFSLTKQSLRNGHDFYQDQAVEF